MIHASEIDDELLSLIENAKWGEVSGSDEPIERHPRDERIEKLETLLHDIALMADGHKTSRLYVGGVNVALENIRNMAAFEIGLAENLRRDGTLYRTDHVETK